MPRVQLHYIVATIGKVCNKDAQKTVGKLVKKSYGITKLYCHLNFNHTCFIENLLPKSLKFSPLITTSRGYRLARKHGFEFLKSRITECHLNINHIKQLVETITEELQAIAFPEHWTILP